MRWPRWLLPRRKVRTRPAEGYRRELFVLTITPDDVRAGEKERGRYPLDEKRGVLARALKRHFKTADVQAFEHSGWVHLSGETVAIFFDNPASIPAAVGEYALESHRWPVRVPHAVLV